MTSKEYKHQWYLKNKDKCIKRSKENYIKNFKDISKKYKKKYIKNKEKILEYQKEYYSLNKEYIKDRVKKYRLNNKIKIREMKRKWKLKNWKQNEEFRLKENLRHRIYMALKGTVKSKKTMDLLGTSIDNLWIHLEKTFKPGMTKNNYGKIWQIDHKIPCAAFDLTKPEEQAKCFHYTNLQALFAKENLSKGAKLQWLN
jgi:hypothetical protein